MLLLTLFMTILIGSSLINGNKSPFTDTDFIRSDCTASCFEQYVTLKCPDKLKYYLPPGKKYKWKKFCKICTDEFATWGYINYYERRGPNPPRLSGGTVAEQHDQGGDWEDTSFIESQLEQVALIRK